MAVNIFQVTNLNYNLFISAGTVPAGLLASEMSLVPDNFNAGLSRYTKIMGIWNNMVVNSTNGYPTGAAAGSFGQPNGNSNDPDAFRPAGGYFVRGTWFTDERFQTNNQYTSYGYVGSFIGGYDPSNNNPPRFEYTFDSNPGPVGGVDYEPIYAHGAGTSIAVGPISNVYTQEWRDSNSQPVDGSVNLTSLTSAYSRNAYAAPAYFVANIDSAGSNTIGSGAVTFHLEMRPTVNLTAFGGDLQNYATPPVGARSPIRTDLYGYPFGNQPTDFYTFTGIRKFGSRALSIFMGRVFDGTANTYAYPFYENFTSPLNGWADHIYGPQAISDCPTTRPPAASYLEWQPSTAYLLNQEILDRHNHVQKVTTAGTTTTNIPNFNDTGGTTNDGTVVWTDQGSVPVSTYITDIRVRETAMLQINEEYYLLVQNSKVGIFSNKTTTYPLVFADLSDTWGTSAGYRIAGVAVFSSSASWQTVTAYTVGQTVLDPFGSIQIVTSISGTGTSGGTTPFTSATAEGVTTTDNPGANQIVWKNAGLNKTKIYFVSEAGSLALYDFTQTNGVVSSLTAAPALASGAAYGACAFQPNTGFLYTIAGCMSINPTVTTSDATVTPGAGYVGLIPYSVASGTWGVYTHPTFNARHNARSLREVSVLRNGYFALLVERVTVASPNVSNAASGGEIVDWQLMLFNPAGAGTWNTSQVYGDGVTKFSFGTPSGSGTDGPLSYENNYNATVLDVTAGPTLLVQSNWRDDNLFVVDGSQALGTISNTNVTNVSRGGANDIFSGTTAPANPSPLEIRKSLTDDRTLFWFNEAFNFNSTYFAGSPPTFFMAPPSWTLTNWTTGVVNTILSNTQTGGTGNVAQIATDRAFVGDVSNHTSEGSEWTILGNFFDHYVGVIIPGYVDSNSGQGEYGIHPNFPYEMFAHHNWQAMIFMPTYFKWSGSAVVMADSWAQAAANPIPVSSTPGTNIPICYGLVLQFGTTSGSSYTQNEYHTFNLVWGNTKFARKSRYVWSMFAGQTFLQTDVRPLSAVNAIRPSVIIPEAFGIANVSITGPASITTLVDGCTSCATWPLVNGGTPQNTPAVVVLTCNHPDVTTIINRPHDGKVYSASSAQSFINGSGPAVSAFQGNPNLCWVSNTGNGSWIGIDLGTATTVNSYSFTQAFAGSLVSNNQRISAWQLQGSPTGLWAGEQTTVDTQTGVTPTRAWAGNVGSPGSYRYYRILVNTIVDNVAALGFLRLFTSTLQNTFNFSEITAFSPYWVTTSQGNSAPMFMRGMKFEVSTDGLTYTPITPLWRAHLGGVWCFPRQVGIQKVRITCNSGYQYYNYVGNTFPVTPTLAVGPFQFTDYGSQAVMDAARLGNSLAPAGTAAAGSFDPNCIGIATDAVSISIDTSVTPSSIGPQYTGADPNNSNNTLSSVLGWWMWTQVPPGTASQNPNGYYRVHPFWGFVLFGGPQPNLTSYSGGSDQIDTQAGTNMTITYHWGRRI